VPLAVKQAGSKPVLPTRKQEFCSPSLQSPLRYKTHAFLPTLTPPLRQIYHTMTIPARLPGLCHLDNLFSTLTTPAHLLGMSHLDNFIMTLQLLTI
jgi:hypothetical protein